MNKKQGITFLADVIEATLKDENIKWVLSGQGHQKLILEKRFLGNASVVITDLKPIEELNDWLNIADIHVIPQRIEVSGLVLPSKLLGIMAIGKPVVTNAPKNSDLFTKCKNCGLLVEPNNLKDFSAAIIELSKNEVKAKKLGNQALKNIIGKLDKETVLNNFNSEISNLIT
jgi:colanic acid biosynthesis glycosyl transferase WcaI